MEVILVPIMHSFSSYLQSRVASEWVLDVKGMGKCQTTRKALHVLLRYTSRQAMLRTSQLLSNALVVTLS